MVSIRSQLGWAIVSGYLIKHYFGQKLFCEDVFFGAINIYISGL